MQTADNDVLAIRIPPSAAMPHVLRGKGVVYVREPGGKRPVDTQDKLVAMCQAAHQAEELAIARLREPPLIRDALAERIAGPAANGQTRVADWLIAATPMHVPDDFARRSLTKASVTSGGSDRRRRFAASRRATTDLSLAVESRANGYVATGRSRVSDDELVLTVDAGGSVVARWSTRVFRGVASAGLGGRCPAAAPAARDRAHRRVGVGRRAARARFALGDSDGFRTFRRDLTDLGRSRARGGACSSRRAAASGRTLGIA